MKFALENIETKIKAAILGLAIGDALGVPVEFKNRQHIKLKPVTDMIGYGTYNQPPGTWSDDSSMTFCLMQSLLNSYDLKDIANKFLKWKTKAYWTAHNYRFDIGISTSKALSSFSRIKNPKTCGNSDEGSNGNGSLMRILPLAFYTLNMTKTKRFQIINEVSSITHAHIRSVLACYYYIEFAIAIIKAKNKFEAYKTSNVKLKELFEINFNYRKEQVHFHRILNGSIHILPERQIESSGYVIHSLEASVWCLLKSNSYKETVLKAVNLGSDTDTTAAIVGGLAGLLYGYKNIPTMWVEKLARKDDILKLCAAFSEE